MFGKIKEWSNSYFIDPLDKLMTFSSKDDGPTVQHWLNPVKGAKKTLERKCINLLSYNIFLRPPLIKNNEDDHKEPRMLDFIK